MNKSVVPFGRMFLRCRDIPKTVGVYGAHSYTRITFLLNMIESALREGESIDWHDSKILFPNGSVIHMFDSRTEDLYWFDESS